MLSSVSRWEEKLNKNKIKVIQRKKKKSIKPKVSSI